MTAADEEEESWVPNQKRQLADTSWLIMPRELIDQRPLAWRPRNGILSQRDIMFLMRSRRGDIASLAGRAIA